MRKIILAAVAALALSGCATQIMQSYVGRTVQEAMVSYGQPSNVFDMPDGRRAFQWSRTSTSVMPSQTYSNTNIYAPPGAFASANTYSQTCGGNTVTTNCLYTVYGQWDAMRNAWVIVSFEQPRLSCM